MASEKIGFKVTFKELSRSWASSITSLSSAFSFPATKQQVVPIDRWAGGYQDVTQGVDEVAMWATSSGSRCPPCQRRSRLTPRAILEACPAGLQRRAVRHYADRVIEN